VHHALLVSFSSLTILIKQVNPYYDRLCFTMSSLRIQAMSLKPSTKILTLFLHIINGNLHQVCQTVSFFRFKTNLLLTSAMKKDILPIPISGREKQ